MNAVILPFPGPTYEGRCCGCGSAWFELKVKDGERPGVVVGQDWNINGYFGVLACRECGGELED